VKCFQAKILCRVDILRDIATEAVIIEGGAEAGRFLK
jgi:hypothetical protein